MADCTQCADYEWCAKNEECGMFKQKQMTNADRIRAMTDEELAFYIVNHPKWFDEQTCLSWLKLEVDDGQTP